MPKTILNKIDTIRRRFFWQGGGTKKKYHLVRWPVICKSKKKGGLGIKDLRKLNVSLLAKWWWKLEQEDSLWHEIVKAKYLKKSNIFSVTHKASDSPIWADLIKIKELYLQGRGIRIKNGQNTRFWFDPWLYELPIYQIAPILFLLCEQKEACVAEVKTGKIQISFSRWLTNELQTCWDLITDDVNNFQLQDDRDEIF